MATVLEQKIVLKTQEFSKATKQIKQEFKDAMKGMKDELLNSSKAFQQNESQATKWGRGVSEELKRVGRAFKDNLATGAKALALNFGTQAVNKASRDALELGFSFSKAFAEIKAKSNASEKDLKKWRDNLMSIGRDTGASIDSLADSFKDLFNTVGDKNELMKVMGVIGQAAAITGGDASETTGLIKENLVKQGKAVNEANVRDLLSGAQLSTMKGDFENINQALGAFNQIGGVNISKSGLSSRQLAALLSGASQAGGGQEMGTKAVAELLGANANGLMQGSILNSLFGGGFSGGKVDVSKIVNAESYKKLLNLGGGNEKNAREIFKRYAGEAGMSEDGAEALFNMIKNFESFNKTFKATVEETKTFEEFFNDATDNLPNAYQRFISEMIKGFSDIFGGFESPIKNLLKGNFGQALGGLHSATGQAVRSATTEHPALAVGALLTTAAGGMLIKDLLPKLLGKGMGGKLAPVADTAKGVGMGMALKQMGVTPVYVVNAAEVAGKGANSLDAIRDLLGLGGAAGGAGGAAGGGAAAKSILGRAGAFLGKAGQVGLAGYAGYWAGDQLVNPLLDATTTKKNKYGQDSNIVERGFAKLLPEWAGGITSEQYKDMYGEPEPQKVVVEVQVNDPMFSVVPRGFNMQRDAFR